MRLALAKLLLRQPDVLLLDEPTNHLDLESVTWLEGFSGLRGRDRHRQSRSRIHGDLVDHCRDRLGQVKVYRVATRLHRRSRAGDGAAPAAFELSRRRSRHGAFIERFRAKNTKAKQAQDRAKKLEKIERIVVPEAASWSSSASPAPRTAISSSSWKTCERRTGQRSYEGLEFALYRATRSLS